MQPKPSCRQFKTASRRIACKLAVGFDPPVATNATKFDTRSNRQMASRAVHPLATTIITTFSSREFNDDLRLPKLVTHHAGPVYCGDASRRFHALGIDHQRFNISRTDRRNT